MDFPATITDELLLEAASDRHGYTRKQLAIIGVPWPPPRGWKRGVVGKPISGEDAKLFVSLKKR